ncbi:MAG: tetratricopeptide repeat protein [Bacteroidota bacterium]
MPSPREDQILDYLNGHLGAEELRAFEQALATDTELREEVELQKLINTRLREKQLEDQLRPLVEKAHKANSPTMGKVASGRISRFLLLAVAAVVVLLCGWFLLQPASDYSQQLALKYQQKNPPVGVLPAAFVRNRRDELREAQPPPANESANVARYFLATGDLPAALRAYQRIPDAALTDSLRFETAILQLHLGQPQTTLDILKKVPEAPFDGGPYWYRALAYLTLKEVDLARTQVQRLLEEYPGTYRADALSLLAEL